MTADLAVAGTPPCDAFDLMSGRADVGWTTGGRDLSLPVGPLIGVHVARRCGGGGSSCTTNADCGAPQTCDPTCDTSASGGADTSCELAGPDLSLRCQASKSPCVTDADCAASETCAPFVGPPLPLFIANTPFCVTSYLAEDLTGTLDLTTGESMLSTTLRWQLHLGLSIQRACPTCGDVADAPAVGESRTCHGGPNDGLACTVEAVSDEYGGVSSDCPPSPSSDISGAGVLLRLHGMTTGTAARQAVLPCAPPLDYHPSLGNAVCTDFGSPIQPCQSNADCAPGVTCGFYCHCGFCDGDTDLPCFDDADCEGGASCVGGAQAVQQEMPNECASLVCGAEQGREVCDSMTPPVGRCSQEPPRGCSSNADCAAAGQGECVLSTPRCFEDSIVRRGKPSPLRKVCNDGSGETPCSTNADCGGNECAEACPTPTYVGLVCVPPTMSTAINSVLGLTGPAAITLSATAAGATTTTTLPASSCGQPVSTGAGPTASDCLYILRASVGSSVCTPQCICDTNGSGTVSATDSLVCLKAAVGQPGVTLDCPC